jgi:ornithine decarboxylase
VINTESYASVGDMLVANKPLLPVYCIYPHIYREAAQEFVTQFPGRVLYAVKANDDERVITALNNAGINHFDCASLPEIEKVSSLCPDAICYFMTPVRLRGAAREAQRRFGVRHFMVDHASGIEPLSQEIDMGSSVIFVRMAVHHASACEDLSTKFGAQPEDIPSLIQAVTDTGAEAALAFNVGSAVTSPDAYAHSISVAEKVLSEVSIPIRLVDIGGGFAKPYPGFPAPPIVDYISVIRDGVGRLDLAEDAEILCEPGRALSAPGLSAVVEVLLKKEDSLYLNDGMYGIFWELRCNGHDRYHIRCYRDGKLLEGATQSFKLFGPTCDSSDLLPSEIELPAEIAVGDYIEFGSIGAYSMSGRTAFNGHYSDIVVNINEGRPPSGTSS